MGNVTFDMLSAYHDREVDGPDAARMGREVLTDAEARAILAAFEEVDAAVRESFEAELDQPVPLHLARAVRSGFAARKRAAIARVAVRWVGPMAAAIAIVVVGNHWSIQRVETELAQREQKIAALADQAVQDALEHALSGARVSIADDKVASMVSITPTRTYKSESQHWCREFTEELVVDGERVTRFGLACREADGGWRRVQTKTPGSTPPLVGTSL